MGPRKITEIKVKFSGISEIYPRLYVFQISWEHPDKKASSTKGERGWWLSLFSEKMGEGNLSKFTLYRMVPLSAASGRKEERMVLSRKRWQTSDSAANNPPR